ncbi:GntR family transcriptional regulator [Actinobaculum suis]|uniref:GntR family transcriptional regulator n=1 Tax=Actinobaculum suis TaxID=1657 RepID=UPI0008087D2F|nr:GntR family transcriptional regulator [Actinobaculum suis]OCA93612.1 hypothetical protein ACU20_08700 [Actinobaculum suis]OCA93888.1 hypothetical protein ACU21_09010 [Actinobaculum suis]
MKAKSTNPAAENEPIVRAGLRDDVYKRLIDGLLEGEYKPQEPLTIDQISRELGVSQTPVREALVQLERTGLVERTARRGYRVAAPLTAEQMKDLIEVRQILERAATRKAFVNREDMIGQLEEALVEHEETVKELLSDGNMLDTKELRKYFDADWKFHEIILAHSENPYLEESVNALSFQVHRMRQTIGTGTSDGEEAVAEHSRILHEFRHGTAESAARAMEAHLAGVLERSLGGK